MKGQRKVGGLQVLLSMLGIALGAALHGWGIVGFWGMITIMMIPNVVFMVMQVYAERYKQDIAR
ncbi:hypothetical protein EGJ22_21125 [Pseudomonas sp. p99-361]|uniref:Uncharacterized protein n=1 Tax=Pseudomonas juntendi TaxID=2666183 RepID=A0AAJ5V1E6_9PSED|nr:MULTISPECIES: hypothetical protein [Pseudomonas]OAK56577.1 hypothetical protein A3K88_23895 [Pseudomonas putida]PPB16832.1 hypothetical protein HV87_20130 [Pseudomonas aeruginosa]MCL8331630.1 hypothetical protein [Pseudomonas juntendi]MDH0508664.1 hypothetical protein [Pseudomonas juntendi]MDM1712758.1 hypothetical protein [Pseudomonas sp. 165]